MLRARFVQSLTDAFRVNPVTALLGPRQCGKTTLVRQWVQHQKMKSPGQRIAYFDLEDSTDLARLEDPKLALEHLTGVVVLDEIQRLRDLFPLIRVLVDRPKNKTRFLILGSASRDLIHQSSETLAGRISLLELFPFSAVELGPKHFDKLWLRGGFPKSFLAKTQKDSFTWRKDYISTFLERDIPALGIKIPAPMLRRFWMMLTHYHGQLFNASEVGNSLAAADTTVRRYLDILTGTFMIRQLPPWWENIGKRQVKTPKIYFRDAGILHSLLGISDEKSLTGHPKLGASWEGFALEETLRLYRAEEGEAYFWATHNNAELDLLILKDGKRLGFEFKYTASPRVTKSMKIALQDLKLDSLKIIFPGKGRFPLDKKIEAAGFAAFLGERPGIRPIKFGMHALCGPGESPHFKNSPDQRRSRNRRQGRI